jgi:predicted metal-dependent phosphoesterase TrpH
VITADLHLHTRFSDGTFTPEELADRALKAGLGAIALTDHDTVGGCPEMSALCEKRGIEFIPGTELTAECNGSEVHVLGYWLNLESVRLATELAHFQSVRHDRVHEIVRKLNHAGVPLLASQVFAVANCESPGRPHVARAMLEAGLVSDYDSAFDRFLKKGRPAWVPKARMDITKAVELIHDAGGVAVLAHPALYKNDDLIPRAAGAGIDGLECWHTKHSTGASENYLRYAAEYRLVATGGSDCHGMAKGTPLIGTLRIPYAQVKELKTRCPAPR